MTEDEAKKLLETWSELSNAISALLQTPLSNIASPLGRLEQAHLAMHPALRKATWEAFHPPAGEQVNK